MRLLTNQRAYNQLQFEKESDFEREVVIYSKLFFGQHTIYIDSKRKIDSKALGNSVPDGFLFDLSDKENPEFYIVEVELAKHDFYNHIFPQITKFLGFYKNFKGLTDLTEKIFSFINNDNELKKEFKKYLGENEVYKFLMDTIQRSQNILLVIDGEKKELPEIMDTYSDTWGKVVKLIQIKRFAYNGELIYSMHPEFENIEFAEIENETAETQEDQYTEEYHLEGVSETVRNIYGELKAHIVKIDPSIRFNPQKYYISIRKEKNLAFFIIGRKKSRLVVMQSETETRRELQYHPIKTLTEKVQKFWNGPSCAVILETTENLGEVKSLLSKLLTDVTLTSKK